MQRIDGATAASALPAPGLVDGTPGFFTDGDPSTPVPPTVIPQWWLNMIQEEIMSVVLSAAIVPSKANHAQLLAAIQALITTSRGSLSQSGLVGISGSLGGAVSIDVPAASDAEAIAGTLTSKAVTPHALKAALNALIGGAPSALDTLKELADAIGDDANFAATVTTALSARALAARQVVGGGLATGGGALTGDLTITVAKALAAAILAGTDDASAITPAQMKAAWPYGGTWDRGWTTLPGGYIEQWGSETIAGGANTQAFSLTFPTAFASGCGSITGSCDPANAGSSAFHPLVAMFGSVSTTGASGWLDTTDAAQSWSGNRTLRWRAIGK